MASTNVPVDEITHDPRWKAIERRDTAADGTFVYGVVTTGIFCSPSCASRRPRPENVRFFSDGDSALAAGFRPCKRCRQGLPSRASDHAARIARACRQIESAQTPPALNALAAQAGMSASHFHRVFKAATGLTPHAYAVGCRQGRMRQALAGAENITGVMYDTGYRSSGRFYSEAEQTLGMTPAMFRAGGKGMRIHVSVGHCSLGEILVAHSERGICAILLGDDAGQLLRELRETFPHGELLGSDAAYQQRVAQVIRFVDAPRSGLDLPLDIRGTAFQQRVWQVLRAIAPGETLSYRQVAERVGAPGAVRAVAGACAANLLAVAIPCHRVVRSDGTLSGYRWGVERKRQLLAQEADDGEAPGEE
ncbi:Methylated-DNA--protein-cysteine methyltransferase [Sodalis praecaptivus]|uniref:methylated-DNA--[protein]-cysteine S-methyltransferase n=1 Tax=Sodalis praecaptivus TaxID=1239307 RepID=W0HP74_9GAMM|nr:bifunctional DNA-binding transcriptional regulator/O6-methylguanine-DNA methyltransferase Ada [Sodalis praecaptivus]AHF75661.1 Methylated-DNA--protein-cysteine methyltransferase [Sodalis praecaptivus]